MALTAAECPANPASFGNCDSAAVGALCEADGELSTNIHLDNCYDDMDFYKRAECHDASKPVLVDDGSEGYHCCCGPSISPPPSPPRLPASTCSDNYDDRASAIMAGDASAPSPCDQHLGMCVESHAYSSWVRGLCPKSCGNCANFCLDDEVFLQGWIAVNQAGSPYRSGLTCATATHAELRQDPVVRMACGSKIGRAHV